MTTDSEHEWQIEELLHRRTDLSTFVIHWTRDYAGTLAKENLGNILACQRIEARTALGVGQHTLENLHDRAALSDGDYETSMLSQRVVCFTETPLEHAWSFVCNIAGRTYKLQPFGLAFRKKRARQMGINPIWYTDATSAPGRSEDWLSRHIERLVERAAISGTPFADDPIAKIAPFVEVMGTWESSRKEFWWEREWLHLGDLTFSLADVAVVLCRESDMDYIHPYLKSESGRVVPAVDPTWGLEHIISRLAGAEEE